MKLTTKALVITLFLPLLTLTGCVTLPTESITQPITPEELSAHVDFLTQPALKGRPTQSLESKIARDYLTGRLKQYGCVPWADTATFEQDFGLGTNVIGVLPGADPNLSNEIILISAHYDHLKPKSFSYYPGAADNAAAVAVLLEIAEKLSQNKQKSKRSICFAFFDAEEKGCLGSFAFTSRADYDDSSIVGVINIDLLGRQFFDVVNNSLCVTGTGSFPNLQRSLHTIAQRSNMWLLPISSDLIGPVSDHAAFVSYQRPVLFFSCGLYKDYHTPQDTPDKLSYLQIKKSGQIIEGALLALANSVEVEKITVQTDTNQEFRSTLFILNQIIAKPDKLALSEEKLDSLKETRQELIALFQQTDTSLSDRMKQHREALNELLKLFEDCNPAIKNYGQMFNQISTFYSLHPEAITHAYRDLVRHYLANKPSLFKNNDYTYNKYLPISKDEWGITKTDANDFIFGLLESQLHCEVDMGISKTNSASFGLSSKIYACKGSPNDIADYISLEILRRELIKEESLKKSIKKKIRRGQKTDIQRIDEWKAVYDELTTTLFPEEAISSESKFVSDPNRPVARTRRWFLPYSYQGGTLPFGHDTEIGFSSPSIEDRDKRLIQLLHDPNTPPEIHSCAISTLGKAKTASSLNALVDILDDTTLYDSAPWWLNDKDFPLSDHKLFRECLPEIRKYYEENEPPEKTFGQLAQDALKTATGQDFGTDKAAWKEWIEKNY